VPHVWRIPGSSEIKTNRILVLVVAPNELSCDYKAKLSDHIDYLPFLVLVTIKTSIHWPSPVHLVRKDMDVNGH